MDPFDKLLRDAAGAIGGPEFREQMVKAIQDAREIVDQGLVGMPHSGTLADVLTMVVAVHLMAPKPTRMVPITWPPPGLAGGWSIARPHICPHFTSPRLTTAANDYVGDCKAQALDPCIGVDVATGDYDGCIHYKMQQVRLRDKGLGPDPIPPPTGL